ncbi:hypothetical protein G3I67_09585 [Orrella sp. NBD-18]|uniref:DUF8201 domain-containing protein n=1 Tax=Sheuella amnicola TaxID=2707330 RepID=A0A6B2QZN2_9BURK|nr:hypothetical protein [Sheuella amnicola]NDY83482.1 hypothetical protein [Sheuella amnicola]
MIEQIVNLLLSLLPLAMMLGLTAVVLLGWGRLTLKLIGFELCSRPDTVTIWLGFGIVLGLIDFLHVFFPVDWKMTVGIGVVGLIGCKAGAPLHCMSLVVSIRHSIRKHWFYALLGGLIVFLWCLRAMGVPNNYDSGLYHFETIRWLNEYPLVPGLGNLHWRFAFNQSHFNFLALLNLAPFWGKGYASGGLFLLLLSVATVVEVGLRQDRIWRRVFGGTLFIYFGYVASSVANPAPDGVIGLVQVAAFLLLFRILGGSARPVLDEEEQKLRDVSTLMVLCLTMTTIKLTGALFALTCIAILMWKCQAEIKQHLVKWMILLVILLLMAVVHLSRGYLLSGFPLFPGIIFGAADLPWSMPVEFVRFEADLIKSWARMPGVLDPSWALASWAWVPIWIKSMSFWTSLFLGSAVTLMLAAFLLLLVDKMRRVVGVLSPLYLPLIATLIFWFTTAPDPRFLGSIPVLSIALSIWFWAAGIRLLFVQTHKTWCGSQKALINIGMVCICLASLKLTGLNSISLSGWKEIPTQAVEGKTTSTGLTVWVPTTGAQCWDQALPCASIFNENLAKQKNIFLNLNRFGLANDFYYTVKVMNQK